MAGNRLHGCVRRRREGEGDDEKFERDAPLPGEDTGEVRAKEEGDDKGKDKKPPKKQDKNAAPPQQVRVRRRARRCMQRAGAAVAALPVLVARRGALCGDCLGIVGDGCCLCVRSVSVPGKQKGADDAAQDEAADDGADEEKDGGDEGEGVCPQVSDCGACSECMDAPLSCAQFLARGGT